MEKTITLIRISIGIIFLWYGMLKFFPSLSPAEELATKTMDILLFGLIAHTISIKLLSLGKFLLELVLFLECIHDMS